MWKSIEKVKEHCFGTAIRHSPVHCMKLCRERKPTTGEAAACLANDDRIVHNESNSATTLDRHQNERCFIIRT